MPPLHPHSPMQPRYGYRPNGPAQPAVSIITPYYNTGPIFLETVGAILRQSLQQWEWIIVNDGSDDPAALRVLLPLRNADSRIRVLDQPNRGLPATRNAGAAVATAPLLFFLDSDDLLAPTALEQLAWSLYSRSASAFAGGWNAVFGAENLLAPRGFNTRYAFPYDNVPVNASMMRREAFHALGGFRESTRPEFSGLEDYDFWVRAAAQGLWGHDICEYLVWIRRKALREYTDYQWAFRNNQRVLRQFRDAIRSQYPHIFLQGPPAPANPAAEPYPRLDVDPPFANRLQPVGQRRVLMLLPSLMTGGADRVALDLAAGLQAGGDRVSVCLLRDLPHTWKEEMQHVTSDLFNLPAFLAPADYPRFLRYLIESRAISHVLISNSLLGYELLPFLRAHCPQVAFIDYIHAEQEQRHGGFARVAADHDELLELHIVTSQHLRRFTIERGAAPERVEVCTINIDTTRWAPDPAIRARVRAEQGISEDTPLILFIGRLSAEKRPHLVAQALLGLRTSGTPFKALIIGDGEDSRWLRYFLRQNRLEPQVQLLGNLPHTRVHEHLAAADLLLLPSQREGIAMTLYEALAMGVVPVAADVGGQRELVTPACGILIPHSNHELNDYVNALKQLCTNPAQRQRMSLAGRARVEAHFSAEHMLERMRMLLDRASLLTLEAPRLPISPGVGLATATLAIEHEVLDTRLRRLAPVRLALALRWSSAGRLFQRLRSLRVLVEQFDRLLYIARREAIQRVRAIIATKPKS